jgi:hypothetical protein
LLSAAHDALEQAVERLAGIRAETIEDLRRKARISDFIEEWAVAEKPISDSITADLLSMGTT